MFNSRQARLVLVILALGGGTWLLGQPSQDSRPKSGRQSFVYSICNLNNDVLMLDALHGKTWMLRRVEGDAPTWLPIPIIDSEKEAAQLWRKNANHTAKSGKNADSSSINNVLKGRGYDEVPLKKLRGGYLCVDLLVEGKKVFLAVDTAAPITHLDTQRVKHLQLKWQHWAKGEEKGKAAPKTDAEYCEIAKLEIGGLEIGNLMIGSHDLSDINKNLKFYSDPPIDGVLGSDALTKLHAMIDCDTFKLYIRSP